MMRDINPLFFLALMTLLLISACHSGPQLINYGNDQCNRCKMIITQQKFGAELITNKGRIYKYDAIECLIPVVLENEANSYSHILVTDYNKPGQLIDATSASYLVSKAIPSPMGAYLSAFASPEEVHDAAQKYNGDIYDWTSLISSFDKEIYYPK